MAMSFGYVYLNASTQDTWRPEIIEQDKSFQTWKTHCWKTTATWTNVAFSYRQFSDKREMHIEPLLLKYISMWGEKYHNS